MLVIPIYIFFKKTQKISNNKKQKKFNVGTFVCHKKNIFSTFMSLESFFIDKKDLPKENVLFIDDSSSGINIKDYKKRKYNYTRISKDKEIISQDLFWNNITKKFLPTWIHIFVLSFFEDSQEILLYFLKNQNCYRSELFFFLILAFLFIYNCY
ncbi:MAG: hypothetical protein HWN79_19185, partial [Candidatus Lokiarchaeota archaeon]|nr:hypothetical protein [Candidatus Lokiarchaeota archaeon]